MKQILSEYSRECDFDPRLEKIIDAFERRQHIVVLVKNTNLLSILFEPDIFSSEAVTQISIYYNAKFTYFCDGKITNYQDLSVVYQQLWYPQDGFEAVIAKYWSLERFKQEQHPIQYININFAREICCNDRADLLLYIQENFVYRRLMAPWIWIEALLNFGFMYQRRDILEIVFEERGYITHTRIEDVIKIVPNDSWYLEFLQRLGVDPHATMIMCQRSCATRLNGLIPFHDIKISKCQLFHESVIQGGDVEIYKQISSDLDVDIIISLAVKHNCLELVMYLLEKHPGKIKTIFFQAFINFRPFILSHLAPKLDLTQDELLSKCDVNNDDMIEFSLYHLIEEDPERAEFYRNVLRRFEGKIADIEDLS